MNQTHITKFFHLPAAESVRYVTYLLSLFAGLLIPIGFAPFHKPGLSFLGIALLFYILHQTNLKKAFLIGFTFGLGFFGLGVSWVYISIHQYGQISAIASALITFLFVAFLSLYLAFMASIYRFLTQNCSLLFSCILFSALWCLTESIRSTFLGGFPWLLLGFGQTDTPYKYLLPFFGVYGASFFACLSATFLAAGLLTNHSKRFLWIIFFVLTILAPILLKYIHWDKNQQPPLTAGVIQANLAMRDKWDDSLFWRMLEHYQSESLRLISKNHLIVLPESAIPVPVPYISDFIDSIAESALKAGSAVVLGTLQPALLDDSKLYNTMMALGEAQGTYQKQHLVPFGEFIPVPFYYLFERFALPIANLQPGKKNQPLIFIKNHPIAALICYELAYPQLLRSQLPLAEWIISISDDGWFGHSFAMYQQLQMAQTLSIQTARYQIMANNDGLSSIIDSKGKLVASLPAYTAGTLEAHIHPVTGSTPWIIWGDKPILFFCLFIFFVSLYIKFTK